jgi:hypothetical protein
MKTLEKVRKEVKDLDLTAEELHLLIEELEKELHAELGEVPCEVVPMSELGEELQKKNRVIVMDRKLPRKIKSGEESKIDVIIKKEGVRTSALPGIPAGDTTISGTTVTANDLAGAITRDFGPLVQGGAIFLSDGMYFLYPDSEITKVLSEDLTDLQMWINTYFDCDDFAEVTTGVVNNQLKGIPFGTLWFKGPGIYHAVNCFYSLEQKKMKVLEPQTDGVYDFDKANFHPVLVVI